MPRYFFHIVEDEFVLDTEGIELPNLRAVQEAAMNIAAELLKGGGEQFWRQGYLQVEVVDESGMFVLALAVNTDRVATVEATP